MNELIEDAEKLQRLMLRLSWASQRRLDRDLEAYGLTLPQYMTLRATQRAGPDGISMTALANASHQLGATMTGIVDRLAAHGLLVRQPDPHDRRAQRISLTPAGQDLLANADLQQHQRLVNLLERFSVDERAQLMTLMENYLKLTLEGLDP